MVTNFGDTYGPGARTCQCRSHRNQGQPQRVSLGSSCSDPAEPQPWDHSLGGISKEIRATSSVTWQDGKRSSTRPTMGYIRASFQTSCWFPPFDPGCPFPAQPKITQCRLSHIPWTALVTAPACHFEFKMPSCAVRKIIVIAQSVYCFLDSLRSTAGESTVSVINNVIERK